MVKKEYQRVKNLALNKNKVLSNSFGILKNWKKPTDKIMQEIDEELWFEE